MLAAQSCRPLANLQSQLMPPDEVRVLRNPKSLFSQDAKDDCWVSVSCLRQSLVASMCNTCADVGGGWVVVVADEVKLWSTRILD